MLFAILVSIFDLINGDFSEVTNSQLHKSTSAKATESTRASGVHKSQSNNKRVLHESGLSYNPDRTHSVSVEIIGD